MPEQTIVAQFATRPEAEAAAEALLQAGIDRDAIRVLPGSPVKEYRRHAGLSAYDHGRDDGGFWASLDGLMLPDEDRYALAEGMSRGAVTVAIGVDGAEVGQVDEIVEGCGALDMDEREAAWAREGWPGYRPIAPEAPSGPVTSGNSAAYAAGAARDRVGSAPEAGERPARRAAARG